MPQVNEVSWSSLGMVISFLLFLSFISFSFLDFNGVLNIKISQLKLFNFNSLM